MLIRKRVISVPLKCDAGDHDSSYPAVQPHAATQHSLESAGSVRLRQQGAVAVLNALRTGRAQGSVVPVSPGLVILRRKTHVPSKAAGSFRGTDTIPRRSPPGLQGGSMSTDSREQSHTRYTVRVFVDKATATDDIEAMWQWFRQRQLDPPAFRHSIRREAITVQLDSDSLHGASEFAGAFNGVVLGMSPGN
jgi:hypothetical protein